MLFYNFLSRVIELHALFGVTMEVGGRETPLLVLEAMRIQTDKVDLLFLAFKLLHQSGVN
jgi:hypothetical protein